MGDIARLFQQFWERTPGKNWDKLIDLTSKIGEINDIEHIDKGSKIYPRNQIILDCIMPFSVPFKHTCLSFILIWVLFLISSSGPKKKFFFSFLHLGKTDMVLGKKVAIFDWKWGRNSAPRDGQKIPCIVIASVLSLSPKLLDLIQPNLLSDFLGMEGHIISGPNPGLSWMWRRGRGQKQ